MADVLTYCPIASGSSEQETAVLVGEADGGAVDLDLGCVSAGLYLGRKPRVPLLPRGQLIGVERIGQRQHGTCVGVLGQRRCGDRADSLRRTVGTLQLRMLSLERLELRSEEHTSELQSHVNL